MCKEVDCLIAYDLQARRPVLVSFKYSRDTRVAAGPLVMYYARHRLALQKKAAFLSSGAAVRATS